MASETFHERFEDLTPETRDMHRAITSLMEELEAVDWYQQRVDATTDEELKAILGHNRDEEIEHAMMVLEWIRRRNPTFDANAKTYLFSEGPITEVEDAATEGEGEPEQPDDGSLGIGSLKT
ncbi:MAG: ferritin [Labilithrix sp.]|nr:ferritin [Labilithrix sp.]MCW5813086.1 ferritin [Labilithrix sp.]